MEASCLPSDFKKYIAKHLRDDAEGHLSMTTDDYRDSHSIMWNIISWETWKELMNAQAAYSRRAAELVEAIASCKE